MTSEVTVLGIENNVAPGVDGIQVHPTRFGAILIACT